jgi:hypothetical protein
MVNEWTDLSTGGRFLVYALACLVINEITSHHPHRVLKDAGKR